LPLAVVTIGLLPGSTARPPTRCKTSASNHLSKGGDSMSRARLIYFAVFAVLIGAALLPALSLWPEGSHDGHEI